MTREPTDDRKGRGSRAIILSLGILGMFIAGYLGVYLTFGQRGTWLGGSTRTFEGEEFAEKFIPAVWLESKISRKPLSLCYSGRNGKIPYFIEIYTVDP